MEVVNIFALSRVFYIASILPLPKNIVQRIEKIISRFIWTGSGKVLKVSLNENKLPKHRGGVGLLCIEFMSKSLRLSQLLRLLKDGDAKTLHHVDYWMGELLATFRPEFGNCNHPRASPGFFMSLAEIVTDAMISRFLTENNWKNTTNKMLYSQHIMSLPQTKAEDDLGLSLSEAWRKMWLPCLTSSTREVVYLGIHNKLQVRERLFRIGLVNDPYCVSCSDRPIWKFSFNRYRYRYRYAHHNIYRYRYRYRYEENKFTDTDTDQKNNKFTDTDADTDMKNC